jgi:hypothetical protein
MPNGCNVSFCGRWLGRGSGLEILCAHTAQRSRDETATWKAIFNKSQSYENKQQRGMRDVINDDVEELKLESITLGLWSFSVDVE